LWGGPEVVTVIDARDALARLSAGERFDLVLCDLMMPTLSGEEFQRRLRAISAPLADELIFLTGGAFTPGAASFLAGTPNLCLQKPVEMNVLRSAVAERLG
jgi:CheY-like chemotaxis protein